MIRAVAPWKVVLATVARLRYLGFSFWRQFRVVANMESVLGDSFAFLPSAEQFLATVARIRSLVVKKLDVKKGFSRKGSENDFSLGRFVDKRWLSKRLAKTSFGYKFW